MAKVVLDFEERMNHSTANLSRGEKMMRRTTDDIKIGRELKGG